MRFDKLQVYTSLFIISIITITCANDLSSSINTLSNNLYKSCKKNDNLILSPFNAHAALSLAYEGSAGGTSRSLQKVLSLTNDKQAALEYKPIFANLDSAENVTIKIANKIYIQKSRKFKKNFKSTAETSFDGDIDTIDFGNGAAAVGEINNWVKDKTNNTIVDLVDEDSFNGTTRAILLNAIYFKGKWPAPFKKDNLYEQAFYISETNSISYPMMHKRAQFGYSENGELDATVLKLEYKNNKFTMYIILPNSITGINDLEKKLSNIDVNNLDAESLVQEVQVALPKFKIESTLALETPLTELGLGEIFNARANFSNMIEGVENLDVERMIQKAVIEVNDEGSVATTAIKSQEGTLIAGPPPTFIADHPFMFIITADLMGDVSNKIILFIGKVVKPSYK